MDQIALIVLTVATNALVTGVLLFLFQKRMESSLARKNFEHQVKFSKIYVKSLDVLETYRQKLIACGTAVAEFNIDISNILFLDAEVNADDFHNNNKRGLYNMFLDINQYLRQNTIYIPDRYLSEIEEINSRAISLHAPAYNTILSKEDRDIHRTAYLVHMMDVTKTSTKEFKEDTPASSIALTLISKMLIEYNVLSKRLEEIYKEVADIST